MAENTAFSRFRHPMRRPSLMLLLSAMLFACMASAEPYAPWVRQGDAIPAPLGGRVGDARRGRMLVADVHKGNCLACHQLPVPEEPFHGTIGPALTAIGARLTAGQLRLRLVDESLLNPQTIMPPFYREFSRLNQVAWEFEGRTFLTAQEIEDILAYLLTLTEETKP